MGSPVLPLERPGRFLPGAPLVWLLLVLTSAGASAESPTHEDPYASARLVVAEQPGAPNAEAPYDMVPRTQSFDKKFRKQLKGLQQPEAGDDTEITEREVQAPAEDYGARSPSDEAVGGEKPQSLTHRERRTPQWKIRARRLKKTAHKAVLALFILFHAWLLFSCWIHFWSARTADLYLEADVEREFRTRQFESNKALAVEKRKKREKVKREFEARGLVVVEHEASPKEEN